MTYTLRVAVRTLGEKPVSGIDAPVKLEFDGKSAEFQMIHRHLIVRVSGFPSEAEAEAYLPRVKAGLWNIALTHHVAFVPEFSKEPITYSEDPVQAGKNIAASFGLTDSSPVHGLGNQGGYAIFKTGQNIRFLGGDANVTVSNAFEHVGPAFSEGAVGASEQSTQDKALLTAMSLYVGQFFENAIRARLLTLMMVLEVLAPDMQKHPAAVEMLQQLQGDIDVRLKACTDEDERFALESLVKELDFRKETSIRRRVRALVQEGAGLQDSDRKQMERDIVKAYDLRSQLVHTGSADENEIHKAHEVVFRAVKALLRGRLGLQ